MSPLIITSGHRVYWTTDHLIEKGNRSVSVSMVSLFNPLRTRNKNLKAKKLEEELPISSQS